MEQSVRSDSAPAPTRHREDRDVDKAAAQLLAAPVPGGIDRRALVAYASWLHFERAYVCRELYPHLGWKAAGFVVGQNAGFEYHRNDTAPAASRAEAVLRLVGCDWSQDGYLGIGDDGGPHPDLPDFPHPDARLLDLERLFRTAWARVEQNEADLASVDRGDDARVADLEEEGDAAVSAADQIAEQIYRRSAHTLEGLALKVRVLRENRRHLWIRPEHGRAAPEWYEHALTEVADGVEHLLSVRGLPGGAAVHDVGQPGGAFAELTTIAGGMPHDDGTVTFTDASGKVLRAPVAAWIAHFAMRLWHRARVEAARQLGDPALDAESRAALALRLRRDLRVDALHTLAFRAGEIFEAWKAGGDAAAVAALPRPKTYAPGEISPDLHAAIEAHREAVQLMLHDPEEGDDRTDAACARIRDLLRALLAVPARSLADLRWRMIYLWSSVNGEQVDDDAREILARFMGDVEGLVDTPPQEAPPEEAEESDEAFQARFAATPIEPIDINSPCPIPMLRDWIHDGKTVLPWLRLGFVYLAMDRDTLVERIVEEDAETDQQFTQALTIAARNFEQLHRFCQDVLQRRMVGLAVAAQAEAESAGSGDAP